MNNKKYELSLPDIYFYIDLDMYLIELIKKYSEKFYDDFFIGSVYGSVPCVWNGGRTVGGSFEISKLREIVKELNKNNIAVRYTFTNNLLEQKHFNDRTGNSILKMTLDAQTRQNDINIGCDNMLGYIEKNYPEFRIVLSTTYCVSDPDRINKMNQKYIMVPDYQINNKWDELKKIEKPENIEILLNDTCLDNCPIRRKHYEAMSRYNLRIDSEATCCAYTKDGKIYSSRNEHLFHHVDRKDFEKYYELGINKFKLTGRGSGAMYLVEGVCEYMVKPEFKEEIWLDLKNFVTAKGIR